MGCSKRSLNLRIFVLKAIIVLRVLAGHDRLNGRGAGDALFGQVGDDLFVGTSGHDLLRGGSGTDLFVGNPCNTAVSVAGFGPGPPELFGNRTRSSAVPDWSWSMLTPQTW